MGEGVKAILAEGGNDEILKKKFSFQVYYTKEIYKWTKKGSLADNLISGGFCKKYPCSGTSMVVQWLRVRLAMQGMQVCSLMGEQRSPVPLSN